MIGKQTDRLFMAQRNSASGVDISYQTAMRVHAQALSRRCRSTRSVRTRQQKISIANRPNSKAAF